ncbi:hypothetical protein [Pontibacter akesuensis]|uniref:Uncharacterized protein n=1 Tax=Pontibacter akesuensis TaxID=388950 RepID=A0A1I7I908_9BACT|nr:hypothetical protein [Pontibacter akesuensis]GHA65865.1 hypothetical protein GCM10007389_18540 [Pontibacter akesuensis]SFU69417.1 hypothetical protein SAMN04487941_2021 [Pontibacter akesuensis]
MARYTHYIALTLLLLFCRAMVPDALIQELHPHTHTVHTDHTDTHKAQIGLKHKHCQVEDIFSSPYQGTALSLDFTSITHHAAHAAAYTCGWQGNSIFSYHLRGPPAA